MRYRENMKEREFGDEEACQCACHSKDEDGVDEWDDSEIQRRS